MHIVRIPAFAIRARHRLDALFVAAAFMAVVFVAAAPVAAGQLSTTTTRSAAGADSARAIVTQAYDLMGGEALEQVERVRLDMMTQWQRASFQATPYSDRPSYEPHVDVRDYSIPAWRNTRLLGRRSIVNIVRDSVAVTDFGSGPQPLSIAYVDERNELFVYTPDRLILLLRTAPALRLASDTLIGGDRYRLVRADFADTLTLTVAFHERTGLPKRLQFTRAHPNDFGLVSYGRMAVEVWYSNWRSVSGISIPTQWDIMRAGVPYKRMTVRNIAINPVFAADSFHVADVLRRKVIAARKPMHDLPIDSVTEVVPGLVKLHGFGAPAGAVRVGQQWVLLQAGYTPLNLERGLRALATRGVSSIAAAIVVRAGPGNAGLLSLADDGVPLYTSASSSSFVTSVWNGAGRTGTAPVLVVRDANRLELSGAHLRLEPLDLPDVPGSVMIYEPRLAWLYVPDAATRLDVRIALDRARALGFRVSYVGTAQDLATPVGSG